jgi:predicted metal-dependent hydrolase
MTTLNLWRQRTLTSAEVSSDMCNRQKVWEPRKVDDVLTMDLLMSLIDNPSTYAVYAETLMQEGWIIRVVGQVRGHCHYSYKTITIPAWIWKRKDRVPMLVYYLSHELAHAKAGHKAKHGPLFMTAFKSLCPKEYQHYEFDYKPSYALAAGILPEDF